MATERKDRGPGAPADGNPLDSVLRSIEDFVQQITSQAIGAAGDGDQRILIASTGESLVAQTAKLTAFTRESADRLSPVQRIELNRFLSVQDAEAQAKRVIGATQQILAKGILGKLLHWISQHLKELKKVLLEILHFIFKLLHIPWPDWLDTIVRIIDELLDLVLSLLSEVFGIDFRVTARELSEQEVNFLRETAAFEAVRAARAGVRLTPQEES
ncbi:MAG TPA: hypothetical protein VII75_05470 [Thermoanaerobaculia bacterium]